jgi:6-phosphogluconate dehydrogenase
MSNEVTADIGLIGLGTMGAMLALNMAEKGFRVAVWNRTGSVTDHFAATAGELAGRLVATGTLEEFVAAIARPRTVVIMVQAGPPVDETMAALRPLLDPDDLVVDAGNADYRDTMRRSAAAAKEGPHFLGLGVSGGAEGARHGPAVMAGGRKQDWDRISRIFEAIAAHYDGEPCAAWLGEGGAGHFVKTVHNGIEYADMQMIAEIYGVLRDGMGLDAAAIATTFRDWNKGPLASYLIEITGEVAATADPETGRPIVDVILDRAGQKGTGRWTAIVAQELGTPVPVIEAAVAARNVSARLPERRRGEDRFGPAPQRLAEGAVTLADLEQALTAGKILCYAQGFLLLAEASRHFGWGVPLPQVARIWRAGCIIRSAMLNDMAAALARSEDGELALDPAFAAILADTHHALRKVVSVGALSGLAMPALSSALSWFDMMRTARGTANLIQAQRDFFGSHGFERVDRKGGGLHGPWVPA